MLDIIFEDVHCTFKVTGPSDKGTYKVMPVEGFDAEVNALCRMRNTDNGLQIKFPNYSIFGLDKYITLEYDEAQYLYFALKKYFIAEGTEDAGA